MDGGLILCSFFLLSQDVVLPMFPSRDPCYLLQEERGQELREAFTQGRKIALFGRWHRWCLEDGTAEQVKLIDCFIFQDAVLQLGFQSKTYSVNSNQVFSEECA